MGRKEILAHMNDHGVRFLRLVFTDITGNVKNVEVPASQFEKALDGEILFDGSSIEGFTRIEESDMLLAPDFDTYRWSPSRPPAATVASTAASRASSATS